MTLKATGKLHSNRSGLLLYISKAMTNYPGMPFRGGEMVQISIEGDEIHIKKISKKSGE